MAPRGIWTLSRPILVSFKPKPLPKARQPKAAWVKAFPEQRPKSHRVYRKALDDEYRRLRAKFLRVHRFCECCPLRGRKPARSREVHHKRFRGRHYLEIETFLAICRPCHRHLHDNVKWAFEVGVLMRG